MSQFLHVRESFKAGDIVTFNCNTPCTFMIMTDLNFLMYKQHGRYQYYGKYAENFPISIKVPKADNWNIVIDMGWGMTTIKYAITYKRNKQLSK